jgi:hypothetical protein
MLTKPYTHEELRELRERLQVRLKAIEEERPNIRPLPPMTEEEAKTLLLDLIGAGTQRLLTQDESFMAGQLLSAFCMGVEARMLNRPGRYFVMSEADVEKAIALAHKVKGGQADAH